MAKIRTPPLIAAAPKPIDPNKVISKPPRLKPTSTRVYGKGGTPIASAPNMGLRGAGIGYGGPEDGV